MGFFSKDKRPKRNTVVMALKVEGTKCRYAPARVIGNDSKQITVRFADGTQARLMPGLIKQ